MKPRKVVVTDYIEPDLNWERQEMAQRGVEFLTYQLKFAPNSEVIAATRDADVVIVNMVPITPEIVSAWERCRLVIRHGVGYDNVDVAALEKAGIPLCYIPDYCAEEVAEQAIALLLACGRRLTASRRALDISSARGAWDFKEAMPIFLIAGRTLGIIGCGRIGSLVYRKLQSFGFKFLICDPYLSAERKAELEIEVVDKETVFRNADFITIHTPLNAETRHLVNGRTLAMMKPTAYLVNTSRGLMVDLQALAKALESGVIAGERIETWKFKDERPEDEEIRHYGSAAVATGATGAAALGFHDHQAVIEDLAAAIEHDREPMITLASVRPTLEWALAMYQSAKQGAPVDLPLADEQDVW